MRMRPAAVALVAALATGSTLAQPHIDYLLHCAGCHLRSGAGDPPEVPDLRAGLDRVARIPAGRSYLARVPGAAQAPISDARLAELLNWMLRTLTPDPVDFEPFTADEIAEHRSEILMDPLAARPAIWKEAQVEGGDGFYAAGPDQDAGAP